MTQLLAPLLVAAATFLAPHMPAGWRLCYRPSPGQRAAFHVTVDARGTQTLQDEQRTVRLRAEFEVSEETQRVEGDGSFWARVTGRALRIEDPTGTFGSTSRGPWPAVLVHLSPRGEVLETKPEVPGDHVGPLPRAFARAMLQPIPVVLPKGPVAVGETWEWERAGARQVNRLEAVTPGNPRVARIISHGRAPVHVEEVSPRLGLTTTAAGQMEQDSEVELLLPSGVVALHQGEVHLTTRGEVALWLGSQTRTFPLASDIRLRFSVKLTDLNGRPRPDRR